MCFTKICFILAIPLTFSCAGTERFMASGNQRGGSSGGIGVQGQDDGLPGGDGISGNEDPIISKPPITLPDVKSKTLPCLPFDFNSSDCK